MGANPPLFRPRVATGLLGLTALLGLLVGCAVPRATPDPAGRLDVLGPHPGFSTAALAGDWVLDGDDGAAARFVSTEKDGVPAVRVAGGAGTAILARRTDAILLVTPYLSWAWNVEAGTAAVHPVRLIAGFHGGDPAGGSWGSQPLVWLGTALPPHDRAIEVVWGDSALKRGTLDAPPPDDDGGRVPRRYTVTGGSENAGAWRLETVDLAALYARAWPGDDITRVRIAFVGVAARGPEPEIAYVSGVVLSR